MEKINAVDIEKILEDLEDREAKLKYIRAKNMNDGNLSLALINLREAIKYLDKAYTKTSKQNKKPF